MNRGRHWFRFSLRMFAVLLTVVGLALGWLAVQVKWIHDRRAARVWIAEHAPQPGQTPSYTWFVIKPFPWGLRILREQPVHSIVITVGPEDRKTAEGLQTLFPEASVQQIKPRDSSTR